MTELGWTVPGTRIPSLGLRCLAHASLTIAVMCCKMLYKIMCKICSKELPYADQDYEY